MLSHEIFSATLRHPRIQQSFQHSQHSSRISHLASTNARQRRSLSGRTTKTRSIVCLFFGQGRDTATGGRVYSFSLLISCSVRRVVHLLVLSRPLFSFSHSLSLKFARSLAATMLSSLLTITLTLLASVRAIQVTSPSTTTLQSAGNALQLSWQSVSTDPTSFAVVLVNQVCSSRSRLFERK
jgi:hypothetical protein